MGINAAGAQFLLAARAAGVSFKTTATIGRQTFCPTLSGLRPIVRAFGLPMTAEEVLRTCARSGDQFLALLGAETVTSIDASDYEGATLVHDMNEPVDASLRGRFSAVFDGGSLEHIFNFPQAMRNCLEMVKEGGHFLSLTCANNFMGHGFYQFSPELFFRALSPLNGFEALCVLLCLPYLEPPVFYAVRDPAEVRGRGELVNDRPVYLLAIGRRTRDVRPFAAAPQQSFYEAKWEPPVAAGGHEAATRFARAARCLKGRMPARLLQTLDRARDRFPTITKGFALRGCYSHLTLEQMARGQLSKKSAP